MRQHRSAGIVAAALAALVGVAVYPVGLPAQDISTVVLADDGVPLATDVWLPAALGRWPTILVRTPYGRDQHPDEADSVTALGFAFVVQDTRGRFGSGGEDTVFRDDGADGRATLRWIAAQPWSDGDVCTFGGSALGITQYMLSPDAPDALRCTMPVVATPDLYRHAFLQGGALREALVVGWLQGQGASAFLDQVLEHRLRDGWWEPLEIVSERDRVAAPGLHVGGWYDIFGDGTIDAFSMLQSGGAAGARGRQYLLVGPWTHDIGDPRAGELEYPTNAVLDIAVAMLAWYGHWLHGLDTGVDDWPAARVYLMGAVGEPGAPGNEWLELDAWPPATQPLELYLAADGGLHPMPAEGAAELRIDPGDPVPTLGGRNLFPGLTVDGRPMGAGSYDQRPIEARDDVLTFNTAPLDAPLVAMGRVTCTIWVEADTPDLDLAVRLTDVYPDGRSMLVTDGIQRARMRCGEDRECLLTPGVPTPVTVDLWSTAIAFNAGHRVRVSVSGSNAPRFEVNPNHGGDLNDPALAPVVARPRLLFGPATPSRLTLPVPTAPRRPAARHGG